MRTVDEIFNEALTLPNTSRVLLVEKLVETLDFDELEYRYSHLAETQYPLWEPRQQLKAPFSQTFGIASRGT